MAAQAFKAEVEAISIEDVGFAVIADSLSLPSIPKILDLAAVCGEFAGQAAEFGDVIQGSGSTGLIAGEGIHQVDVAPMVAAEVVVVAESLVVIASVEVSGGRDAVDKRAVMQHRQIETVAIPADKSRREAFDAVKKALYYRFFIFAAPPKTPKADAVGLYKEQGDGRNTVQMVALKSAASVGKPFAGHKALRVFVRKLQTAQSAVALGIGDGFNVEDKNVRVEHENAVG